MLFSRYLLILYLMCVYVCVCYFQSLSLFRLYLEVGVSPEGNRNSRFISGTHHLLHAPSLLCPRTLQPWHPIQSGSRDVTPKSLCLEGSRVGISFPFYQFSSHHLNWSTQVNDNLVFFSFSFYDKLFHFCIVKYGYMTCWGFSFIGQYRVWSMFPSVTC